MILSLAASENIPLVETKRKILQSITIPKNMVYDYNNFPLLNSSRIAHDSSSNYNSHNQFSNISQYNRFSVLNASNHPVDMLESSFSSNPVSLSSYKNDKPSFSQTKSRSREKTTSCPHKSPQKHDNKNFSAHKNLLLSPNGRSPNSSSNGVGYSNHSINGPPSDNTASLPLNAQNQELPHHSTSYNPTNYDDNSNFDIDSLNNAFLSLTKNMEFIFNLVHFVCSSHNGNLSIHSSFSNSNEQSNILNENFRLYPFDPMKLLWNQG